MREISGREPITVVELWQDKCCNVYGTSLGCGTCNASGSEKCYNTLKTCQDLENYQLGDPLKLRFAKERVNLPRDINIIPILKSVSSIPTKINVGSGDQDTSPLGERSVVNITFNDIPHSDLLVDPYKEERTFNPYDRGTFWTKWLARNPFYQNRRVVIYEGYSGQDINQMRKRTFFIDKITGPNDGGTVTIKAKDALKFLSNEKAKFPEAPRGFLQSDISETTGTILIKPATPFDIDLDQRGFGYVRIGDEIIRWDTITSVNFDSVEISNLTRGDFKTEADSHDEGDSVQACRNIQDEKIVDVVNELMQAANVPNDFIPLSDWQNEGDRWLASFNVSTLLAEPFGISELLSELTEQCLFYIWWDDFDQEIKLRALRPIDFNSGESFFELNDEQHIIAGSLTIKRKPEQRVSRVYTYFSQIKPTEDVDKKTNYKNINLKIDADAEREVEYGDKKIREVFARFLQGSSQVLTLNSRISFRYNKIPEIFEFSLDAKDRDIKTGDVVDLTTRQIIDENGLPKNKRLQIIKVDEQQPGHSQRYTAQSYEFDSNYAFIMGDDANDYNSATQQEKDEGGYWSDGNFDDGKEPYRII